MYYILMHKRIEVAKLFIDDIHGGITSVDDILNPEHLPLGTFSNGEIDRKGLNDWWKGRAIPASRNGIKDILEKLGENDIMSLVLKGYGLSLSDQYWVKPEGLDINWDDINYFDNDFSEDVGNLLFGGELPNIVDFQSPDNTSDGWLKKRWKIFNGERILIKGGSNPFQQEPFNEVIASKYMKKLGIDCVSYDIVWQDGYPYSICRDFISKDTELISANHLMKIKKKSNNENTYQHFVSCCKEVGLDAVPFLDRMLTVDFIIANEDRHFNNFGLIRNAETLEFVGFAPIYDSGTSLCYNRNERQFNRYESKPFHKEFIKQAALIKNLDWLDADKAASIQDDIKEVLSASVDNGFMTKDRVSQLKDFIGTKVEYVLSLKSK